MAGRIDPESVIFTPFYPRGTESFEAHRACKMTLSGTHKGNRFCLDHRVKVADRGDQV